MNEKRFDIIMLDGARNFLKSLDTEVKKAIAKDLQASAHTVNSTLFKKLTGKDIWEFRTKCGGKQYRLLSFWDKTQRAMVIATHGFVKKTQKTPPQEIKRAESIMKLYYEQKKLQP